MQYEQEAQKFAETRVITFSVAHKAFELANGDEEVINQAYTCAMVNVLPFIQVLQVQLALSGKGQQ